MPLNVSHFILLKERDLGQIEYLGRQLFGIGESKRFVKLYEMVALSRPHGIILCEYYPYELVYQWSRVREREQSCGICMKTYATTLR